MTRELESAKATDEHGRFLLARGRLGLGKILFALGRHVEAEEHWRGRSPLRFAGTRLSLDFDAYREELDSLPQQPGVALGSPGSHRGAIDELHRVIELLETSVAARPGHTGVSTESAGWKLQRIGGGSTKQATSMPRLRRHRRAIELFEPLSASQPGVAEFQDMLAHSGQGLALDLAAMGNHEGAIDALRLAIKLYEAVLSAKPKLKNIRGLLGATHSTLGLELWSLARRTARSTRIGGRLN